MEEKLQQRLQTLKTEYEAGQKMLAELEAKQTSLRETLLRISGAIQVLEETLAEPDGDTSELSAVAEPEKALEKVVDNP